MYSLMQTCLMASWALAEMVRWLSYNAATHCETVRMHIVKYFKHCFPAKHCAFSTFQV